MISFKDFLTEQEKHPTAILTAFRQDRGSSPKDRLEKNREANKELEKDIRAAGLKFTRRKGDGMEPDKNGKIRTVPEESYVIQPVEEISEQKFIKIVKKLLLKYRQWGGVVKFPGSKEFLLSR